MDHTTPSVRERQTELEKRYAERPEDALIPKLARTEPADSGDPFHSTVAPINLADPDTPYGVTWRTGIDQAIGGLHDAPNPGEMLCATLAACFDGTIRLIAARMGVELEEVAVDVSADVDVRGSLDIDRAVRVGLGSMQVEARVRPAPGTRPGVADGIAKAAERLCITLDTLRDGVPVTVNVDAGAASQAGTTV